ncbi:unnamed protein product [Ceratitis capitata]|uniref:(Mediterranean fruit fly) hypothetical protein n=1 Tax=Ceratitis capitata TaxID=7213 RepID=A0A811U4Y1_CERCA|nr:unnamed protein product [Ceratitis capitata]
MKFREEAIADRQTKGVKCLYIKTTAKREPGGGGVCYKRRRDNAHIKEQALSQKNMKKRRLQMRNAENVKNEITVGSNEERINEVK